MKRLLAALLGGAALAAAAAQPDTETFAAGSNGWHVAGSGFTKSFAAGNAAISFSPSVIPATALLIADTNASSGAYSGNYDAAAIVLFGFDFRADASLPSDLSVVFQSGTNTFARQIPVTNLVSGVWTTVVRRLEFDSGNGWFGPGTNAFFEALTNITALRVQVTGPTVGFNTMRFDNLFIQTRPAVAALQATTNFVVLSASSLQANVSYALESAETITSDWTTVSTFSATAGVSTVSSGTTNANFFRLKW